MTKPDDASCWWCEFIPFLVLAIVALPPVALFWDTEPFIKWRVALQYGNKPLAHWPTVTLDKQPHDCDFWTAPVGVKHCHYERVVIAAPPWNRQELSVHYARVDD